MHTTMKKLILIALIINVFLGTVSAQMDPDQRDEKLAAYRAEVYTRVLRLTAEEAQNFWPVYNEFLERRDQIQAEYKPAKQEDQMSDAEVEEVIKRHFEKKQRDLDLEKDLYQKLRKVLPLQKLPKSPTLNATSRTAGEKITGKSVKTDTGAPKRQLSDWLFGYLSIWLFEVDSLGMINKLSERPSIKQGIPKIGVCVLVCE